MRGNDNAEELELRESVTRCGNELAQFRRDQERLEARYRQMYEAGRVGGVNGTFDPEAEELSKKIGLCKSKIIELGDVLDLASYELRSFELLRNAESNYKVRLSGLKAAKERRTKRQLARIASEARQARLNDQLAAAESAAAAAAASRAQAVAQGLGPDVQGAIGAIGGAIRKLMKGGDDDASKHFDIVAAIKMAIAIEAKNGAKEEAEEIEAEAALRDAESALAIAIRDYAELRNSEALLRYVQTRAYLIAAQGVAIPGSTPRTPPIESMARQLVDEVTQDIRDSIASIEQSEPKRTLGLRDLFQWMR